MVPVVITDKSSVDSIPNAIDSFESLCEANIDWIKGTFNFANDRTGWKNGKVVEDDQAENDEGKETMAVGELVSVSPSGSLGLCLLRLEYLKHKPFEKKLVCKDDKGFQLSVYPYRPVWWPDVDPINQQKVIQ